MKKLCEIKITIREPKHNWDDPSRNAAANNLEDVDLLDKIEACVKDVLAKHPATKDLKVEINW